MYLIVEVFFLLRPKMYCASVSVFCFFPQCVFGPGIQGGIDRGCI